MDRFVLLLRGVNVGGVKISMAQFAGLLSEAGFASVKTVLATGNAVIEADLDAAGVRQQVEQALVTMLATEVPVLCYSRDTFLAIATTPFPLETPSPEFHRYLSFTPDEQTARALQSELPEGIRTAVDGPVLYWIVAKGESTSAPIAKALQKLSSRYLITTRNLNTVQRIATLL